MGTPRVTVINHGGVMIEVSDNISKEQFEEHVLPKVLANEQTCRMYLSELVKRGCQIMSNGAPVDYTKICHQHAIDIIIKIYAELKRKEVESTASNGHTNQH